MRVGVVVNHPWTSVTAPTRWHQREPRPPGCLAPVRPLSAGRVPRRSPESALEHRGGSPGQPGRLQDVVCFPIPLECDGREALLMFRTEGHEPPGPREHSGSTAGPCGGREGTVLCPPLAAPTVRLHAHGGQSVTPRGRGTRAQTWPAAGAGAGGRLSCPGPWWERAQGTNTEAWGSVCLSGQSATRQPARLPATALRPLGTVTHAGTRWDSPVGPGGGHGRGMGMWGLHAVGHGAGRLSVGQVGTQGSFQNRVLAEETPAGDTELTGSL